MSQDASPLRSLSSEDLFRVEARRWLQGGAAEDIALLVSVKGRVLLAAPLVQTALLEHKPLPEARTRRCRKFFSGRE